MYALVQQPAMMAQTNRHLRHVFIHKHLPMRDVLFPYQDWFHNLCDAHKLWRHYQDFFLPNLVHTHGQIFSQGIGIVFKGG